MLFNELPLKGAYLIELEHRYDDRGYFARTFCTQEFAKYGLVTKFIQCNTSYNLHKGLIRGLHYQEHPYSETKVVRCTQGAIFDVLVDLRKNSPTYKQSFGIELSAKNGKSLYIPKNFAHGFQVLEEGSEVFYMMDEFYVKEAAREISPFASDISMLEWPLLPLSKVESS